MRRWIQKTMIRMLGLQGLDPEVHKGVVRSVNELSIAMSALIAVLRERKVISEERFNNEIQHKLKEAVAAVRQKKTRVEQLLHVA